MNKPQAANKTPLAEVLQRLDQIVRGHPNARLVVDMARDATNEAARHQAKQLEAARRLRRQRDRARRHSAHLLDALAAAPVVPPAGARLTAQEVLQTYRQLRNEQFPAAARTLHDLAGRGEARDFQLILVARILRKGQRMLAEATLRQPDADRAAFRDRLRDHLGRKLVKLLNREAGCRVNPGTGAMLNELMRRSLALLDDLVMTNPPVRLVWPQPGQPFDPALEERGGGKPGNERRLVRAVLFPGLRAFDPLPMLLERAVVATAHAPE
jgi:hypothetical protein